MSVKPTIIPFPCEHNDMLTLLTTLMIGVQSGEVTGIMVAAIGPERLNGTIETAHIGVDLTERSALISHMQFDVIDSYIENKFEEAFE